MKGLALYAGFVILCTIGAVLIGRFVGTYTSTDISSIVMLVLFFAGLVVYRIAAALNASAEIPTTIRKRTGTDRRYIAALRKLLVLRFYMPKPAFWFQMPRLSDITRTSRATY